MRVAIIGTGGVANRHLGVLTQLPKVEIAAHVSLSDVARAQAQATQWGGRAYSSVLTLLENERLEAAWLCIIPDQHGPPERALLSYGVPFFVEKPLSVDLETAALLSQSITSAGLVTAVGYKFRALDTLPRVRALLAEAPARMAIGAWHDKIPPPLWWRQSHRGGGQMVEQATHLVDLARLLLGEAKVLSAAAARWPRSDAPDSDVADVTAALLSFGDVPATFTATSLLGGAQAIQLQLFCEGHVITITERQLTIDSESFSTTVDPFQEEDRLFLAAIRDQNPNAVLSSYADALATHRLCIQIRDQAAGAA